VKTLPDNPNIDHLRQQAKELLAGLRDGDPTVTLADAQARLAEQYGFRTWTDLKAEVDRVRGRADVADPALARAIAERFGLGEVSGPMRSLARPDESGRRWALETDRGRWAVRTMDTWIAIVDVEAEVALQEAAAAAGVALPAPVRSRDGTIAETIDGHIWRAYEWSGSGLALSAPASAAVTAQVGAVLATLHGLALPVDRISPWHAMRFASMSWPEFAEAATAGHAAWAAVLSDAVPTLVELDGVGADTEPPPPVLSHNSLGPGRAHLSADGRLIVLGWEHAGGQPPAWELANALMDWAANPDGGINAAGARALAAGYRNVAGSLPPLELASFRGAVNSLANYVSGQIHVALDAKTDEDRRYADRNMRHLLTHLPTRATLERLLDAAG